jgi:hypothetical protein
MANIDWLDRPSTDQPGALPAAVTPGKMEAAE